MVMFFVLAIVISIISLAIYIYDDNNPFSHVISLYLFYFSWGTSNYYRLLCTNSWSVAVGSEKLKGTL